MENATKFVNQTLSNVPLSRQIVITQNGNRVVNSVLIFDGKIKMSVSSEYGSIFDGGGNDLFTLTSGMTGFSGQFALQGMQIWKGTEPLSCDFEVLIEGEGCVESAVKLTSLCLPSKKKNDKGSEKITFGGMKLGTLIPAGPNWTDIKNSIFTKGGTESQELTNQADIYAQGKGTYSVKMGNFITFPKVVFTKAEPEFSEYYMSNGKPMSATVSMSFTTTEVATTDMMDELLR